MKYGLLDGLKAIHISDYGIMGWEKSTRDGLLGGQSQQKWAWDEQILIKFYFGAVKIEQRVGGEIQQGWVFGWTLFNRKWMPDRYDLLGG